MKTKYLKGYLCYNEIAYIVKVVRLRAWPLFYGYQPYSTSGAPLSPKNISHLAFAHGIMFLGKAFLVQNPVTTDWTLKVSLKSSWRL
jgi:hypothetical protein